MQSQLKPNEHRLLAGIVTNAISNIDKENQRQKFAQNINSFKQTVKAVIETNPPTDKLNTIKPRVS